MTQRMTLAMALLITVTATLGSQSPKKTPSETSASKSALEEVVESLRQQSSELYDKQAQIAKKEKQEAFLRKQRDELRKIEIERISLSSKIEKELKEINLRKKIDESSAFPIANRLVELQVIGAEKEDSLQSVSKRIKIQSEFTQIGSSLVAAFFKDDGAEETPKSSTESEDLFSPTLISKKDFERNVSEVRDFTTLAASMLEIAEKSKLLKEPKEFADIAALLQEAAKTAVNSSSKPSETESPTTMVDHPESESRGETENERKRQVKFNALAIYRENAAKASEYFEEAATKISELQSEKELLDERERSIQQETPEEEPAEQQLVNQPPPSNENPFEPPPAQPPSGTPDQGNNPNEEIADQSPKGDPSKNPEEQKNKNLAKNKKDKNESNKKDSGSGSPSSPGSGGDSAKGSSSPGLQPVEVPSPQPFDNGIFNSVAQLANTAGSSELNPALTDGIRLEPSPPLIFDARVTPLASSPILRTPPKTNQRFGDQNRQLASVGPAANVGATQPISTNPNRQAAPNSTEPPSPPQGSAPGSNAGFSGGVFQVGKPQSALPDTKINVVSPAFGSGFAVNDETPPPGIRLVKRKLASRPMQFLKETPDSEGRGIMRFVGGFKKLCADHKSSRVAACPHP